MILKGRQETALLSYRVRQNRIHDTGRNGKNLQLCHEPGEKPDGDPHKRGTWEIGGTGLYLCDNLKTLGLPKSVTSIEAKALTFCDSLNEIRYAGTSADWEKVNIGKGNELLTGGSVQIYCTE